MKYKCRLNVTLESRTHHKRVEGEDEGTENIGSMPVDLLSQTNVLFPRELKELRRICILIIFL